MQDKEIIPYNTPEDGLCRTIPAGTHGSTPHLLKTMVSEGEPQANTTFPVEPKIVGYTRDSKGNIVNHHLQDHANTIHTCTGSGRNTDQYVVEADKGGTDYKGKFIKEGDGLYTDTSKDFVRGGLDGISRTVKATTHDAGPCVMQGARYRIRKLTEREVFRLMDVSEEDIDKIQAAGISKTAQYKLAGNSIVVSCLYHIFRKCFIELECEEQQLSLF